MYSLVNYKLNIHRRTKEAGKRAEANCRGGWPGQQLFILILILASGCFVPARAADEGQDSSGEPVAHQALRHHNGSGLDDRVRTLSQALDLDAKQQSELRKVLEGQRGQVQRIWSNTSIPAGYRVIATQAVSDKTADQIRALLNEDQRKLYKPPRQKNAAVGTARPSVEDWMNPAKPNLEGSSVNR